MNGKAQILERESRWAMPVALSTLAAVVLVVASVIVVSSAFGGNDSEARFLREIDANNGSLLLGYLMRALGSGLLAIPLAYLFIAARDRSDAVRGQLIGVVIAGPLFLLVLNVLQGISLIDAASQFASAGAAAGQTADDAAQAAIDDAALHSVAAGFGLGGAIGFAVGMAYSCFHAMRAGLLPRFWGTLGMALGVVSFLFFQFALLWFIYLGLLVSGRLPGGRPPSWEAGEAVPWPSPGEKVAGGDEDG
jgi:hypothetical protein